MSSRLRWKLFAVLLVLVIFGTVGLYPIVAARYGINSPAWLMDKRLKLGLDLNGGVQLVVRVQTDYVLQAESEQAAARLREELSRRGIVAPRVALPDPTHVRVGGVPTDAAAFREAANMVGAGFDVIPGPNGSYVLAMKPAEQVRLRADAVVMTRETIERRVNELGVTEPSISRQGPA